MRMDAFLNGYCRFYVSFWIIWLCLCLGKRECWWTPQSTQTISFSMYFQVKCVSISFFSFFCREIYSKLLCNFFPFFFWMKSATFKTESFPVNGSHATLSEISGNAPIELHFKSVLDSGSWAFLMACLMSSDGYLFFSCSIGSAEK